MNWCRFQDDTELQRPSNPLSINDDVFVVLAQGESFLPSILMFYFGLKIKMEQWWIYGGLGRSSDGFRGARESQGTQKSQCSDIKMH